MIRKNSIPKYYDYLIRKIEYSIVLPCLIVDKYEEMENAIKKLKRGISVDQFSKSVAGD
jgi:hypothetical protein